MTSAGPTDPTRTGDDAVARPEPPAVAAAPARVAPEPEYGFPRALWRGLARIPVPPPADPRTWRSPLRGTWLTSVFASALLVGLPVVILTGLMSYIAYGPQFGQAIPGDVGYLHLPFFDWPSNPSWFYRLTQGLHVTLGMVLTPVVLAKLWSVVPKLFAWPPVRSAAQLLERISLLALVGGVLFEFVTGLMNSQYDYSWGFGFYTAHYYGAWVFIAGFVTHVAIKLPTMLRALRAGPGGTGALGRWLHDSPAETEPEPIDHTGLAALAPSRATLSRRGLIGMVAGGSLLVGVLSIGQTWDRLRPLALLSPRGQSYGNGPDDFQINRTLAGSGIDPVALDDGWRLRLTGGSSAVSLSRRALLDMPQHTATLPIACVEGWSVTRTWTGVRLRDLAALAGVPVPADAFVQSIETSGAFARATLQTNQVLDPDALLALEVGNEGGETVDLSPDHGYPARIIVPALPGVHNTKWVSSIDFQERLMLRVWRNLYGENPLHLLAMVGCFALVGYVVSFVWTDPSVVALAIWFLGAVIAHDLILYPLYALADQPLVVGRWARRKVLPRRPPLVPAINHVRAPVLGSLVLGLIYLPTITRHGEDALRFTSGLGTAGIYQHWLLITGVLFLGSAVVYAVRLGIAARRGGLQRRPAVAEPEPGGHEPEDVEPETAGPDPAAPGDDARPEEHAPEPKPAIPGREAGPRSR